jgi:hypothetical protein
LTTRTSTTRSSGPTWASFSTTARSAVLRRVFTCTRRSRTSSWRSMWRLPRRSRSETSLMRRPTRDRRWMRFSSTPS